MNDLIFNPDLLVLAQSSRGVIEGFVEDQEFVKAVIQGAGVILILMILGKFVWDKRKGQGGGQGGGLGQIVLGLLAAAAIFVPTFLGQMVDTGISGATGALEVIGNIFAPDAETFDTETGPDTSRNGSAPDE
jgi:hypothetical protein